MAYFTAQELSRLIRLYTTYGGTSDMRNISFSELPRPIIDLSALADALNAIVDTQTPSASPVAPKSPQNVKGTHPAEPLTTVNADQVTADNTFDYAGVNTLGRKIVEGDLREKIENQFSERLSLIFKRLDTVEGIDPHNPAFHGLKGLERKIDSLREEFHSVIASRVQAIGDRFTKLETTWDEATAYRFKTIEERLNTTEEYLDGITQNLGHRLAKLESEVTGNPPKGPGDHSSIHDRLTAVERKLTSPDQSLFDEFIRNTPIVHKTHPGKIKLTDSTGVDKPIEHMEERRANDGPKERYFGKFVGITNDEIEVTIYPDTVYANIPNKGAYCWRRVSTPCQSASGKLIFPRPVGMTGQTIEDPTGKYIALTHECYMDVFNRANRPRVTITPEQLYNILYEEDAHLSSDLDGQQKFGLTIVLANRINEFFHGGK